MKEAWSPEERAKRAKKCGNPKGFTMRQFCKNIRTRSKPGERPNKLKEVEMTDDRSPAQEEFETLLTTYSDMYKETYNLRPQLNFKNAWEVEDAIRELVRIQDARAEQYKSYSPDRKRSSGFEIEPEESDTSPEAFKPLPKSSGMGRRTYESKGHLAGIKLVEMLVKEVLSSDEVVDINNIPSRVKYSLDLEGKKLESLPPDLEVGLALTMKGAKVSRMPRKLKVGTFLDISFSNIDSLPDGTQVGGDLIAWLSDIVELPANLTVGGNLNISQTSVNELPPGLIVKKDVILNGTGINSLPADAKIGGKIIGNDKLNAELQTRKAMNP